MGGNVEISCSATTRSLNLVLLVMHGAIMYDHATGLNSL